MEKQKALSESDMLKLKVEVRNSQRILITVIVSTLLFCIVVLVVSSSLNKMIDIWIFTGFCLLFLAIFLIMLLRRKSKFEQDLARGVKIIVEGKITAKYGKRNDDDFGSFIVNGKRYYASGELLSKVAPDQFVEIEVTPHSKTVLGIN